jgi:hypothetical protein
VHTEFTGWASFVLFVLAEGSIARPLSASRVCIPSSGSDVWGGGALEDATRYLQNLDCALNPASGCQPRVGG